jgi:hypothetical protein
VRTELLPEQPRERFPHEFSSRLWLPILSVNPASCRAVERTVGASVSSGGRDTFDSESMLVAPWLALLGFTALVGGRAPAPAPE